MALIKMALNLHALEMRKWLNNVNAIIASNNRLGLVYTQFGDYEKALFDYKDVLEIKEKTDLTKKMILSLLNVYIMKVRPIIILKKVSLPLFFKSKAS
jgi:tetratricopeptide (TPR) repeat protein